MRLPQLQLAKLNRLLEQLWTNNPFYSRKWTAAGAPCEPLSAVSDLVTFPFTTRAELLADQAASPPLGANLTYPLADYKRIYRSSGTTGRPVFWADTWENWQWVLYCSEQLFLLAGVKPTDRLFCSLDFGPATGPWIIYEGARRLGCCCLTAGRQELDEQLRWIRDFKPTGLVSKPGRLKALGQVARPTGATLRGSSVAKLILTGEPSQPLLRDELEDLWDAECFDRYGLSEAGSVASECAGHSGGMHILEEEFIAEVIHPDSGQAVKDGDPGELVLTNLGRVGRPIVRYRTGDLVRLVRTHRCPCGRPEALLMGGIQRRVAAGPSSVQTASVSSISPGLTNILNSVPLAETNDFGHSRTSLGSALQKP